MSGILFIVIMAVLLVPLFLTTRRQKKMMRQTQETQASLEVGDQVMTTSGMHAEVAALQESTVDLEIAPGVITRWERIAIRDRITSDDTDAEDTADDAYESDEYDEDGFDADSYDDSEDFDAGDFDEDDIEAFSAEDLTPEDFTGERAARSDDGRGATRRDGGVPEP